MPSSTPPIVAPSSYISPHAIAFGSLGDPAIPVDADHPLPVAEPSYSGAVALQPDVARPAGRALLVDCAQPGRLTLVLADASELSLPVASGLSILPFAVTAVSSAGLTAVATFASLR